jgi:uncharacterized membrane protein
VGVDAGRAQVKKATRLNTVRPCRLFPQGSAIMWGCDYTAMSRGWEGFFPWFVLPLLMWGIVILSIAYLVIRFFKAHEHNVRESSQDCIDSLAILKARFASGEISEIQFIKMKQTLSES